LVLGARSKPFLNTDIEVKLLNTVYIVTLCGALRVIAGHIPAYCKLHGVARNINYRVMEVNKTDMPRGGSATNAKLRCNSCFLFFLTLLLK
jgi:hypothetical protein